MAQIGEALAGQPADGLVVVAFTLMAVGFFVKAAVVPFHFWLADAYSVAPTPVCLLLSAAMSELGQARSRASTGPSSPARSETRRRSRSSCSWRGRAHGARGRADGLRPAPSEADARLRHGQPRRPLPDRHRAARRRWLAGRRSSSSPTAWSRRRCSCGGTVQHLFGSVDELRLYGRARTLRITGPLMGVLALAVASLPPFGPWLGKALIDEGRATSARAGWWRSSLSPRSSRGRPCFARPRACL